MLKSHITFELLGKRGSHYNKTEGNSKIHMYVWYDKNIFKNLEVIDISLKLFLMSQIHTFYLLFVLNMSSRT